MDDDTFEILSGVLLIVAFLCIPFVFLFVITFCMAYSRTKQWEKEKARRGTSEGLKVESDQLITKEDESQSDSDDSDEEAERKEKEDQERDWHLTFRQKLRKELVLLWKGKGTAQQLQKAKERADRKKLARAVAKELIKMERRKRPAAPPHYQQASTQIRERLRKD